MKSIRKLLGPSIAGIWMKTKLITEDSAKAFIMTYRNSKPKPKKYMKTWWKSRRKKTSARTDGRSKSTSSSEQEVATNIVYLKFIPRLYFVFIVDNIIKVLTNNHDGRQCQKQASESDRERQPPGNKYEHQQQKMQKVFHDGVEHKNILQCWFRFWEFVEGVASDTLYCTSFHISQYKLYPGYDRITNSTNKTYFHFKVFGFKMCTVRFLINRVHILDKLLKNGQ